MFRPSPYNHLFPNSIHPHKRKYEPNQIEVPVEADVWSVKESISSVVGLPADCQRLSLIHGQIELQVRNISQTDFALPRLRPSDPRAFI